MKGRKPSSFQIQVDFNKYTNKANDKYEIKY